MDMYNLRKPCILQSKPILNVPKVEENKPSRTSSSQFNRNGVRHSAAWISVRTSFKPKVRSLLDGLKGPLRLLTGVVHLEPENCLGGFSIVQIKTLYLKRLASDMGVPPAVYHSSLGSLHSLSSYFKREKIFSNKVLKKHYLVGLVRSIRVFEASFNFCSVDVLSSFSPIFLSLFDNFMHDESKSFESFESDVDNALLDKYLSAPPRFPTLTRPSRASGHHALSTPVKSVGSSVNLNGHNMKSVERKEEVGSVNISSFSISFPSPSVLPSESKLEVPLSKSQKRLRRKGRAKQRRSELTNPNQGTSTYDLKSLCVAPKLDIVSNEKHLNNTVVRFYNGSRILISHRINNVGTELLHFDIDGKFSTTLINGKNVIRSIYNLLNKFNLYFIPDYAMTPLGSRFGEHKNEYCWLNFFIISRRFMPTSLVPYPTLKMRYMWGLGFKRKYDKLLRKTRKGVYHFPTVVNSRNRSFVRNNFRSDEFLFSSNVFRDRCRLVNK